MADEARPSAVFNACTAVVFFLAVVLVGIHIGRLVGRELRRWQLDLLGKGENALRRTDNRC